MNILKPGKINGEIGYHELTDWWLSTFTEAEREYINNCYQPMNAPIHTLTQGAQVKREGEAIDTGMFLNGLATWFRSKSDVSIFRRIHEKVDELGRTQPLLWGWLCSRSSLCNIRGRCRKSQEIE